MSDQERALSLVRAARRQLESLRVLRAASRGALLAAALGLLLVLLEKATAGTAVPASFAWWLTLAGALAGVAAALARPGIPSAAAALYLDQRCATEERFVTLWSLPRSEHAPEWARALAGVTRIPRVALPREAGLVPVALFLLFGAGLLPSASADVPAKTARIVDEGSKGAATDSAAMEFGTGKRIDDAAQKLRRPGSLDRDAVETVERAIDEAFPRPEQREAARAEFARARAGDRDAQGRLAEALLEGAGALGEAGSKPGSARAPSVSREPGGAVSSPYPDEAAFLRAYDIEVARLTRRGRDRR